MAGFNGWETAVLRGIGAPVTHGNLAALSAWQRAEGGSATFNPLNTTQHAPGATAYNSVGVRNFTTASQGAHATAQTLLNGHYGDIVGLFRSGQATPVQIATAVSKSPWGTGSGVLRVLGAGPASYPAPAGNGGRTLAAAPARGAGPLAGPSSKAAMVSSLLAAAQSDLGGDLASSGNDILQLVAQRRQAQAAQAQYPGGASGDLQMPKGGSNPLQMKVVQAAAGMKGTPYVWGGNTPGKALDCSGFTQQSYLRAGIKLPRTSQDQFKVGQPVNLKNLAPGDLVFTEPGANGPNHVGMYVGNGMIQQSPHTGTVNGLIPLNSFVSGGLVGARRYTP